MEKIEKKINSFQSSVKESLRALQSQVETITNKIYPSIDSRLEAIKKTDDLFFEMEERRIKRDMAWLDRIESMEKNSLEMSEAMKKLLESQA